MGRASKVEYSPLANALADVAEGAMSYASAAEFCAVSVREIMRACDAKEIETFHHGRRVLLVKKSVQMWLAQKLELSRRERRTAELLST